MNQTLSYRPDIDGLRALAVLSVILFHLGGTPVTGGFIGVDIFFVISGYLITSIIAGELAQGTFSLAHFYERRILRIFPALFLILSVTTIAGSFFLFPKDFLYFGKVLSSAAAFGSNFTFWKESGYFEPASMTIPLLHTWSLAVEEQFYIFFPLCLMAVHKFLPRYLKAVVIGGLIASFAVAMAAQHMGSMVALFYLLPMRAWELLIGSVLALSIVPVSRDTKIMNLISVAGLALIFYALFFFNKDTVFPGAMALFPTLGAAFILYSGLQQQSLSYKILSHRIPVKIGKMSYSLYLWHWPLIVFLKYASPIPWTGWSSVILFAVCFIVSWLSWRFVELPVRYQTKYSQRKIFMIAFIVSVFFIGTGLAIAKNNGFPNRFSIDIQKLSFVEIGKDLPPVADAPGIAKEDGYQGYLGDPKAPVSFLLWGDSHSQAASPGINLAAKDAGKRGVFFGLHSCIPSSGDMQGSIGFCDKFNSQVLDFLKRHREIKTIILVGHWSMHQKNLAKDHLIGRIDSPTLLQDTLDSLFTLLEKDGRKVVFMIDPPHAPVEDVPLYMARAKFYGANPNLEFDLKDFNKREEGMNAILAELKKKHDVKIVDPSPVFCPQGTCSISKNGHALFRDDNHMTTYGSEYFRAIYTPMFEY